MRFALTSVSANFPGPGHGSLFIATLAFAYATLDRVLGLAHLGQKVDLIEQSIRRKATPNSPPRSGATRRGA